MNKTYTVHGAALNTVEQVATLADGSQVNALIPCLHIELVPTNGTDGTIRLSVVGNELESAQANLTEGKTISVTFE